MTRTVSAPLVRILLPALFTAASAAAGAAAPTPPESLTGRLLPPAAAAVARVEVWPQCPSLDASPRPLATVRPEAEGRFRIMPPEEPLRVRVEAAGFVPAERWMAQDDISLPPLRMQRAQTLELALAGPDGAPLAGIPVVPFDQSAASAAGSDLDLSFFGVPPHRSGLSGYNAGGRQPRYSGSPVAARS
jgi:hypothetical protein